MIEGSMESRSMSYLLIILLGVVAFPLANADGISEDDINVSPDTYLFYRRRMYTEDPREGLCHSFDFNMTANVTWKGGQIKYCEGMIGGEDPEVDCDEEAEIFKVSEFEDSWVCYTFTTTIDSEEATKFVWFTNEDTPTRGLIASSCDGEPPLDMYRSDVLNGEGMCGIIPDRFLEASGNNFKYIDGDSDDACTSFKLGFDGNQPAEGERIRQICDGNPLCHQDHQVTMKKIRDIGFGEDEWDCIEFERPAGETKSLWLTTKDNLRNVGALYRDGGCKEFNIPFDAFEVTFGETCPTFVMDEIKHFDQDDQCHSFDLTSNAIGNFSVNVGNSFTYCSTTDELRAACEVVDVNDLKYDENPNGEHAWVCVDFIYHDSRGGTEKSLWVKTDQTKAGMGESCEWKDAPIGDELEDGHCQGLPEDLTDELQFTDFDGQCQYFNFSRDETGAGFASGVPYDTKQWLFGLFRYCVKEVDENFRYKEDPLKCDKDAVVKDIKDIKDNNGDDWFCVDFSYDLDDGEGKKNRSVWLNYASQAAVLSRDCVSIPKEFRISNSENCNDDRCQLNKGRCYALPEALREEFRIRTDVAEWNNNDYCQSVNLSGFVLERNWSRNTVDDATLAVGVRPDFFNLFEYCAGTGGYQLCSLQMNFSYDQFSPGPNMLGPNMSSIEEIKFKSMFDNDCTGCLHDWYCVQFEYSLTPPNLTAGMYNGKHGKRSLWLRQDGLQGFASGGTCDLSVDPGKAENVVDLAKGKCPVLPENARKKLRIYQGDNYRCISFDLSRHPGRGDGLKNDEGIQYASEFGFLDPTEEFNVCDSFSQCHSATVNRMIYADDDDEEVCVDFKWTDSYGLTKDISIVFDYRGENARAVTTCEEDSGNKRAVWDGMCAQLPGELQKSFFFLQQGTQGWFDFNVNPNELQPFFQFCKYMNESKYFYCDTAEIMDVVNPEDAHNDNSDAWYCLSYQYEDGYGLLQNAHVWLNPHQVEWNQGVGIFAGSDDGCDTLPTWPPMPTDRGATDNVIRDGKAPTFAPKPSPSSPPLPVSPRPSPILSNVESTISRATICKPVGGGNRRSIKFVGEIDGQGQDWVLQGLRNPFGISGFEFLRVMEPQNCGDDDYFRITCGECEGFVGESADVYQSHYFAAVSTGLDDTIRGDVLLMELDQLNGNYHTVSPLAPPEGGDGVCRAQSIALFGKDQDTEPLVAIRCGDRHMSLAKWNTTSLQSLVHYDVTDFDMRSIMFTTSPDQRFLLVLDSDGMVEDGKAFAFICRAEGSDSKTCSEKFMFSSAFEFKEIFNIAWLKDVTNFVIVYGNGEMTIPDGNTTINQTISFATMVNLRNVDSSGDLSDVRAEGTNIFMNLTANDGTSINKVYGVSGRHNSQSGRFLAEIDNSFDVLFNGDVDGEDETDTFDHEISLTTIVTPTPTATQTPTGTPSPTPSVTSSPRGTGVSATPSPTSSRAPEGGGADDSGLGSGAIAGTVIGVLAAVAIIVLVAIVMLRRRRQSAQESSSTQELPSVQGAVRNPAYQAG